MTARSRFAPSPTGLLHVGNVRTALVAWLFMRKIGGELLLRIDDTDLDRSADSFTEQIKEDLSWLEFTWTSCFHQRDRVARYNEVKERLLSSGLLYPCFETQEELAMKRKGQLASHKPPIYDRASLDLSKSQVDSLIASGKKPHYRFKLDQSKESRWLDLVQGDMAFHRLSASDPIVLREDGTWTFMLSSVIDDADFGITHVIRGDDHINNTAVQLQMFDALGAAIPTFGHLPRITSAQAEISKRTGGFDIKSLREDSGLEPMAVNAFLSSLGTDKEPHLVKTLEDLALSFDISLFHKSPTTYAQEDLLQINRKFLSQLSVDEISVSLGRDVSERLWEAIKLNVSRASEVDFWEQVCFGEIAPTKMPRINKKVVCIALDALRHIGWNEHTWDVWIASIKERCDDVLSKTIFGTIRAVLTGLDHGPQMSQLLPLMSKKIALQRLQKHAR